MFIKKMDLPKASDGKILEQELLNHRLQSVLEENCVYFEAQQCLFRRSEFAKGDGGEPGKPGKPHEIHALHSSYAVTDN